MAQLSRDALDDRIGRLDALTKGLRTEIARFQGGAPSLTGEELRAYREGLGEGAAALQRARTATVEPYIRFMGPV